MFTCSFTNKDMQKFVNFYKRLRIDERQFIINAITTLCEERKDNEYIHNPFLKIQYQAENIYRYCQKIGLQRLIINSDFSEIVMNYWPFTYHEKGNSEYWNRLKKEEELMNE